MNAILEGILGGGEIFSGPFGAGWRGWRQGAASPGEEFGDSGEDPDCKTLGTPGPRRGRRI